VLEPPLRLSNDADDPSKLHPSDCSLSSRQREPCRPGLLASIGLLWQSAERRAIGASMAIITPTPYTQYFRSDEVTGSSDSDPLQAFLVAPLAHCSEEARLE